MPKVEKILVKLIAFISIILYCHWAYPCQNTKARSCYPLVSLWHLAQRGYRYYPLRNIRSEIVIAYYNIQV